MFVVRLAFTIKLAMLLLQVVYTTNDTNATTMLVYMPGGVQCNGTRSPGLNG